MHYYTFQPFNGPLESFPPAELAGLKEVAEGWYVEYKSEAPSPNNLARHLTAFANQHGGWLLIGIAERPEALTAGSFPGIPNYQIAETLTQLRTAAAHHSNPPVTFEHRVIDGPIAALDLQAGRSLIVVGIPESQDTPHVHSSGRIYRRQGDESDPKPETDRHVLNLLWARRTKARADLEKFLSSGPELSPQEVGTPRVFVYLLPTPLPLPVKMPLGLDHFTAVMTGNEEYLFSTTFNNVFPTADGYVARQTTAQDTSSEGMTFRWFNNGAARLTLPIEVMSPQPSPQSYPIYAEFLTELRSRGFGARIGDFSACSVLLTALVGKYLKIREVLGLSAPFFAKAQLHDSWRMIPFLNMRAYVEHIKRWGIPLIQQSSTFTPPGLTPETLIPVHPEATLINGDPRSAGLMTALPLAGAILWAAGIGALADAKNRLEFSGAMMEAAIHLRDLTRERVVTSSGTTIQAAETRPART